jgi:hypothetical protein
MNYNIIWETRSWLINISTDIILIKIPGYKNLRKRKNGEGGILSV